MVYPNQDMEAPSTKTRWKEIGDTYPSLNTPWSKSKNNPLKYSRLDLDMSWAHMVTGELVVRVR